MPVDSGAKNCDTDGQDQSFKTWSPEPGAHLAMRKFGVAALLVVASALSACEFAGSALAPSVTGRAPGAGQPAPIVPLDASKLGTPSGTSAGLRIGQFRSDLAQLQQSAAAQVERGRQLQADMDANVSGYQAAVGTMKDGTQPADAAGARQSAQAQLRAVSTTLDQMNDLSGAVAKNVTYAAYLLESIRAAGNAPDAVEEDHRQLQVLEEATAQTSMSLDRLLNALRQEVLRQSHFLGTEGAKLAQMAPATGVAANAGISVQPPALQPLTQEPEPQPAPQPAPPAGPAGAGLATGRPFVVIPFHDPAVQYEQQLYEAVNAALARSPNVAFDLVAVTPAAATPDEAALNSEAAQANADKVMRSLLDMGLPADRISMTQMTDPNVQRNEVHLYVR